MASEPLVPTEKQEAIYQAIGDELIALTPETWHAARLDVAVESYAGGAEGMPHTIASLEGHREPIMPSDELTDLTFRLLALFREYGRGWKRLRFEVIVQPDGNWRYQCEFEYS